MDNDKQPEQVDVFQIGQIEVGLTTLEIATIQGCYAGEANAHQQRLAIDTIIDKLSMADFLSYQAGSFDQSAFLAGRAYVGKSTRLVIKHKPGETQ